MAISVATAFNEFKGKLELTDPFQETVSTHHKAVREWIQNVNPSIQTILIGSLQRKTRIPPRPGQDIFDIDILVVLDSFTRWVATGGITPAIALECVENIVSDNAVYQRIGPEADSPTITMEYADRVKVELIPAYLDQIGFDAIGTPTPPVGRGYWIPKENRWVITDYLYDADFISQQNAVSDGYLIPVIKMLKAAKRVWFTNMRSYHLEVLASNIIPPLVQYCRNTNRLISYPTLIWWFFNQAKESVLASASIPFSKSLAADLYMGPDEKTKLARWFGIVAAHCEKLLSQDGRVAIEGWNELFGTPFPIYG